MKQSVNGFSGDELKTLILALAHLAHFVPEWNSRFRQIAGKLDAPNGFSLYDDFLNLENPKPVAEEIFRARKIAT